ncbi:phospholipase D family nuclease [Serratia marcescens]|uniref:phospholipase D family nuclease n=1 Tax=Serratia marcescens TaxID=615 RepID=UPI003FA6DCAB|nr:phospholipase D family protein [Serratia marcescens]
MKQPVIVLTLILTGIGSALAQSQVAFSTDGSAEQLVIQTLNEASRSLDLAAYAFTSTPVANAVYGAWRRGVKVRVLADARYAREHKSAVSTLANLGVPVRINSRYKIQHNKFTIINNEIVQTGSLNYTKAAMIGDNAENVLVIRNEPAVSQAYLREFERLWEEGETVTQRY